jgi:Amino acid synthesis
LAWARGGDCGSTSPRSLDELAQLQTHTAHYSPVMIAPQMRRAIRRGRVIIPGHAKVGPPGTTVDLIYGPLDEGWDLDAFDSTPVLIHDAPRPQEIVLWIGYATGPRVNARCKGPDQKEVDALVASFANS